MSFFCLLVTREERGGAGEERRREYSSNLARLGTASELKKNVDPQTSLSGGAITSRDIWKIQFFLHTTTNYNNNLLIRFRQVRLSNVFFLFVHNTSFIRQTKIWGLA